MIALILLTIVVFFLSFLFGFFLGGSMAMRSRQDALNEKMDYHHEFRMDDVINLGDNAPCLRCNKTRGEIHKSCKP